jgi:hypothetical protein
MLPEVEAAGIIPKIFVPGQHHMPQGQVPSNCNFFSLRTTHTLCQKLFNGKGELIGLLYEMLSLC